MARGDQLLRQWNLLKMLQTRGEGVPLARLAQDLGVTERTIQRDFELLQELGFPVDFGEDEYGKRFWKLPHDFFKVGPFVLSPTEAMSLILAEQLFDVVAGTHLADGLESVIDKIRSSMPQAALEHFAEVDKVVYMPRFGRADHKPHADKIRVIIESAQKRQTVRLQYRAVWTGGEFEALFDPYGLVLYDGNLFVVGRSHRKNAERILKVIRIQKVETTDRRFTPPAGLDVGKRFEHSFGVVRSDGEPVTVVVKFTGKAVSLISERLWHASQQLEPLAGEPTLFEAVAREPNAILATYRLSETSVFKSWIKSFGEFAEVLKPQWFRQELHEELVAAGRVYEAHD